jgi:3-methyladenine DNA glycosylase AlkD
LQEIIRYFALSQASSYKSQTMASKATEIQQELEKYSDPAKQEFLPNFFKTGKGQYGEGDLFLGITVPDVRLVAKKYKDEPLETMAELLQSPWHDCRLCALLMLVARFHKSDEKERGVIYDFYLSQTGRINNWDLVDLSAPNIVGVYLLDKPRDPLYRLVASPLLWEQRIAVVATMTLIKNNDFIDIICLSEMLLTHKHDLIHKAVGWMLREVGKRDRDLLVQFLVKHAAVMPRTALRYAIEKFEAEERQYYMGLKKQQLV